MIQSGIVGDPEQGFDRAGLGVARAVDEASDARVDERPGAHRARLERDVERATLEPPGAQSLGGSPDGDDLGMGHGISIYFAPVVTARELVAVGVDDDRTYGYVAVQA